MSNSPAISVLMPVYNGARYLKEAIDSILAQTERDFELIVVDDGSTDASLAIAQRCAASDQRIRVVAAEHAGLVATLNACLAAARSQRWIARMDADDIALPQRLARQVEYLSSHPEVVALGSQVLVIDERGLPVFVPYLPLDHDGIERQLLAGKPGSISHPAVMIRRSALDAVGLYREFVLAEDSDMWLRLGEQGRLANLPDVLLRYRVHPKSFTAYSRHEGQVNMTQIVADAYQRRGLLNVPPVFEPFEARSEAQQYALIAMQALGGGNKRTARRNALLALRRTPHDATARFVLLESLPRSIRGLLRAAFAPIACVRSLFRRPQRS